MGVIKHREQRAFKGPVTIAGSLGCAGTEAHSGAVTFGNSVTFAGRTTFTGAPRVNTPVLTPAGSAAAQFAGFTRLNSGSNSVTVSTTVIKSNALVFLTPILAGVAMAGQSSGGIPSALCVRTLAEGAFFTISWLGDVAVYDANVDVAWKIDLQA